MKYILPLLFGLSLASLPASSCPSCQSELENDVNLAEGKPVSDGASSVRETDSPAAHLTDGDATTKASSGGARLDYSIDLRGSVRDGEAHAEEGHNVTSLVLHWGKFGRHSSGTAADTVRGYEIMYRSEMHAADEWTLLHASNTAPTLERADRLVVERIPHSAGPGEGEVRTNLLGLKLRDVVAIRIQARGGRGIALYELEVY